MVVDEDKAETVRWIFEEILAGKTPATVAKELNRKGIPSKRGGRWEGHVINGMIRNEKYTGDVILQKTFTDDSFTRHINRGEKNMYLISDHHQAIISHEIFEAANAIIELNGKEKGIRKGEEKYQNRYAFSGKIICGECGGKFKRVKLARYFGYSCNTHVKDKNACSMLTVPEETIKGAFVTMMNKLTFGRSKVLVPLSEMFKVCQSNEVLSRINELEAQIERNMERRQQILQFFTKGLLDPAVYTEENEALNEEDTGLKAEKDSLTTQMSGSHEQQEALLKLLKYTAKGLTATEFELELFTEHVDHIVIYGRTEIGFAMKCGPVFQERIG